jgi:hypothetical protein
LKPSERDEVRGKNVSCLHTSPQRDRKSNQRRRFSKSRPRIEGLEPRLLLYHGPTVFPDGSVEVELDVTLDQFGFQAAMFQAYEGQVDFSIFDTGASVVTFSASSQFFFQYFGSTGIPIKVQCGAAAEGVGGVLTGHVSEPGTVQADGLHVANLTFDSFGFPVFELEFDPATAAIVPDVQAFVGALIGDATDGGCPAPASEFLPTITGTPMLNPTADNPGGLAVNIRPQGELLDFSDFPELNGLVLPVPDVTFQQPGLGVPDDPTCTQTNADGSTRDICTDAVRIAVDFVGFDNHLDPGDSITESYNPVQNFVAIEDNGIVLSNQVYLFDTGAQLSIISTEAAEAFGFDLDNPEQVISVQGAAGAVHDIPGFTIDRLSVPLAGGGELTFTSVPIYVLDVAPGLLDGIIGMNLFNNAAAIVYDPFHPAGPSLELNFFTEHLYGIFGSAVGEDEPNGDALTATVLGAGQYGVGEITPAGDADWWAVENANPGDLVFAYVDTQSSTTSRDSTLRVFASDGTTLIETDADDGPDLSSAVAGAVVPQAGRVHFEVTGPSSGTISQYELYQAVVSPTDSAAESETNDSTADADPILSTIMSGSVAPGSGDSDYFSFVATTGSRIVVIMDNDPDGDSLATHTNLEILSPSGGVIQTGDNTAGADGNAAGAIVSAPTTGSYFIRVANSGGGGDDDYRFIVLVLDGGDPLAGAVLMFNGYHAQKRAEQSVDGCLRSILTCDWVGTALGLEFLASMEPVFTFGGSVANGILPVGISRDSMLAPIFSLLEGEFLWIECLFDSTTCDQNQQEATALADRELTPPSLNMILGSRLPAFELPDTIAPVVTLTAPGLTNDATPTVTVTAQDDNVPSGTPLTLDVDLTDDGDFDDAGELNYRTATLVNGSAQFDVTPPLPAGTRRLRARVRDAADNEGVSATRIVIVDLSAPVLSNMPANQTIEATSASGAAANYSLPTATDDRDPNPSVGCSPATGSTFPLGANTVTCTATDDAGNSRSETFTIAVGDTIAPTLANMPADRTVEATSAAGAVVTFSPPTASDLVDPNPAVNCSPGSGSTVALGTTTVTCTATDDAGNSNSASFTVTVEDTTPPTISNLSGDITVEATSAAGAVVNYSLPAASDLVDATPSVDCAPASGSTFPIGATTVTCTATDDTGNSRDATFSVRVLDDATPPNLIDIPGNITVEATGPAGAVVTYAPPGAVDNRDPDPIVQCNPSSGSTFPLGTTSVTCTATDDAGNSDQGSFMVRVQDTTPPVLAGKPADRTVEATSASGAVVAYVSPTATDAVDVDPTVSCEPASGATFPIGTTTVTCTATDDAGNSRAATFQVTVADTTPPPIIEFTGGVLTIIGTDQDDSIQLVRSGKGFRIDTNFGTLMIPTRKSLRSVVVQARGGNDIVNLALLSSAQIANIDGGAGDDSVTAGAGVDIVRGGLGNDQLIGSGGDNLLIGDDGADRLIGGRNNDLLIAGRLDETAGPLDLNGFVIAWRTARKAAAKRAAVQTLIDRVLDDVTADTLTGDRGIDLFASNVLDQITDRRPEDISA